MTGSQRILLDRALESRPEPLIVRGRDMHAADALRKYGYAKLQLRVQDGHWLIEMRLTPEGEQSE